MYLEIGALGFSVLIFTLICSAAAAALAKSTALRISATAG
jgi:hypothetical protein